MSCDVERRLRNFILKQYPYYSFLEAFYQEATHHNFQGNPDSHNAPQMNKQYCSGKLSALEFIWEFVLDEKVMDLRLSEETRKAREGGITAARVRGRQDGQVHKN